MERKLAEQEAEERFAREAAEFAVRANANNKRAVLERELTAAPATPTPTVTLS